MSTKLSGNMLIAQSGGPTHVINQSLVGAVLEAKKHGQIKGIYGSLHGIQGILDENFINLKRESVKTLEAVAKTPSSALGSVRRKPTPEDCGKNITYAFSSISAETTPLRPRTSSARKRRGRTIPCTASTSAKRLITICAKTITHPASARPENSWHRRLWATISTTARLAV